MVFSSLIFLYAFFPLSLLAYFCCKTQEGKNKSLLVFSLIFYAWGEPKFVLLLLLMSAFDWAMALRISREKQGSTGARLCVALTCIVNLGLLIFFKYSSMLCSFFGDVPAFIQKIVLPLGISFYTFQLLTYVIDVYRGEAVAEKKYWHVLLYAALFHQCIAGPIVRYSSISEELFVSRSEYADMPDGAKRFALGLAKKVVLANTCGKLADQFLLADTAIADVSALVSNLARIESTSVLGLWMGIICYTLQIYFDFSAYSDMAIGMGKMVGLHYMENFNFPYISRSVTEFWRRWHISLSTFFRDYVYIPLGGNRCGFARQFLNLFIVWALTGLWHGASLNFLCWGLYYFVFLVIEKLFLKRVLDKAPILSNLYLMIVVVFGWVLFRFTDMRYIPAVFRGLFGANGNALTDFVSTVTLKSNMYFLAFSVLAATPLFRVVWGKIKNAGGRSRVLAGVFDTVDYAVIPVLLMIISTALLVSEKFNPFLYFRF